CEDECDAIDARTCTAGNAYQVCGDYDSDTCLEWNTPVSCGTQVCVDGYCSAACTDECAQVGTRVCTADGSGYRTCGNYDTDSCRDLSDVTRCGTGETCSNGECGPACSDECQWGDYGCSADQRSEWWCYDEDGDGCLDRVTSTCVSGETCRDGWCRPDTTTCTDDSKEQNDNLSAAVWIAEGHTGALQICPDDEDWYYTYLYAGETLTVDLLFSHAAGDLDLKIYNAAGTVVARSTGVTDNEQAVATAAGAGNYYVQVYGYDGAQNGYAIDVAITSGGTCSDDSYEPNNSRTDAAYISPGYVGGLQLCAGDQDWYEIYLLRYESLRAVMSFVHADGDLDLKLVSASGSALQTSNGVGNSETVELEPVQASAYYYLQVYGGLSSSQNSYSLNVTTTYSPPCVDDRFEENDTFATAVEPSGLYEGNNYLYDLAICKGDDDWFRVYMFAGEILDVDIDYVHSNGDLDLYLYDANNRQLDSSIGSSGNENVSVSVSSDGDYYFKVIGYEQAQNDYDLTIYIH
ncbi:MAG: PPC domain-containing protein, partial [Deltaproteobacteria bacterium]|nr:PPC domain-containing protein [Deltaproteobacteria bacterium]